MNHVLNGGLAREASNSHRSPAADYLPAWMLRTDDADDLFAPLQRQRAARGLSDEQMTED